MRWVSALVLVLFVLVPGFWPLCWVMFDAQVWRDLADDGARLFTLLATTVALLSGIMVISLPIGSAIAITLVRLAPRWRVASALILFASSVGPLALVAAGWLSVVGPAGIIDPRAIGITGPIRGGWPGLAAAALLHSLIGIGWVVAGVASALLSTNRSEEEAILLEGSLWDALRLATLPAVRWGMVLGTWLACVGVLTEMAICDIFAQRTFAEEVFTQIELGNGDRSTAILTLPITLFASAGLAAALRRALRSTSSRESSSAWQTVGVARMFEAKMLKAITLAASLLLLLPLAGFLYRVGLETTVNADVRAQWSGRVALFYLGRLIESDGAIIASSLVVSAIAALMASLAAALFSWMWIRGSQGVQLLGLGLATWMSALPGPVVGLALVDILSRPDPTGLLTAIYDSPAVVCLAQAIRVLPWVFFLQLVGLRRLRPELWEQLQLEGASEWTIHRLVSWGGNRRAILIAFLVGWVWCVGETGASKIVAPPGFEPWSVRVFSLLHVGSGNDIAASGLLMSTFVVALGAFIWRIALRKPRFSSGSVPW